MFQFDLTAPFRQVLAGLGEGNAPFMMPLDDELMEVYYPGLTAIAREQTVVQMAGMSAVAFEFALVECKNASDVDAVRAILQARKDAQVDGGAWYPEVVDGWVNNSRIVSNGNFVALFVVSGMTEEVVSNFNALF